MNEIQRDTRRNNARVLLRSTEYHRNVTIDELTLCVLIKHKTLIIHEMLRILFVFLIFTFLKFFLVINHIEAYSRNKKKVGKSNNQSDDREMTFLFPTTESYFLRPLLT